LHYDADFDRIAELTDLRVGGEWLAERARSERTLGRAHQ
jgi:hypothetical protein